MALIDDEVPAPIVRGVDLVGAEQPQHDRRRRRSMPRSACRPAPGTKPRSSPPTRAAAVCSTLKPCQSGVSAPTVCRQLPRRGQHRRAVRPRQRALAHDRSSASSRPAALRERVPTRRAVPPATPGRRRASRRDRSRSAACADQPRSGIRRASQRLRMRALSTGASRRGLVPISRMRVGLLDAGDAGVEHVEIAPRRVELPRHPAGNRCWASRAPPSDPSAPACFRHRHRSPAMAAIAIAAQARAAWRRSRRTPRPRSRLCSLPSRRTQGRSSRRRFSPSIAKRVLSAIHSSFTSSLRRGRMRITSRPRAVDADVGADRIQHVDAVGLPQLPRARHEGVGLGGQRADRAEIDHVAGKLRGQRLLDIGPDFHVLAARRGAQLRHAGDFGREADAARAVDAARHRRLDQRAEILVLHRALVLVVARMVACRRPSPGPAGRTRRPGRRSGNRADG